MAPVKQRDYIADMRAAVGDYLDTHGSVVSAEVAAELIRDQPNLVDGWMKARAHSILTDYVTSVSRTRGARRPREERQARFAKFAPDFEDTLERDGIEAARARAGEFFLFHEVQEDGKLVRKVLGDLNADQVGQVRDNYRHRARYNSFKATVMEKVRERVAAAGPDATVGKIYTPEQINKMFDTEVEK